MPFRIITQTRITNDDCEYDYEYDYDITFIYFTCD